MFGDAQAAGSSVGGGALVTGGAICDAMPVIGCCWGGDHAISVGPGDPSDKGLPAGPGKPRPGRCCSGLGISSPPVAMFRDVGRTVLALSLLSEP